MDLIRYGILIVSDRCSEDSTIDKTGPELERLINDPNSEISNILRGTVHHRAIIKDHLSTIAANLLAWCNSPRIDVILTAGGTGLSERDVTPEATREVIEREIPGISIAMHISSLKITPMAMLSRAVCGVRWKTLIINLPGSPKASRECLTAIASVIPHAVDLIKDSRKSITKTHEDLQHSHFHQSCSNKQSETLILDLKNVAERKRESPFPMISVEAAVKLIKDSAIWGKTECINACEAHGRVLALEAYAQCHLPPFRASIKDGYAVLASDGKGKRKVLGSLKAGVTPSSIKLERGSCVRVNTGAPIPDEATAVVQVEDTKLIKKTSDGMEEEEIEITSEPREGQDIRSIGSDIELGTKVLSILTKIGAAEIGLLAACGVKDVEVVKSPVVGILSTGDEIQEPFTERLLPGHVYDSNKITLMSILRENGFESVDKGIAKDNETEMVCKIKSALEDVDILITSGSVSMGDRDMLKPILREYFKATIHFGRVNMKPGKPTTFATCTYNGQPKYFLCLPGNPVSATVTSYLFVLPLLHELLGLEAKPVIVKAKTTTSYKLDPRPEYARIVLKWNAEERHPLAYSTGDQISSKLLSCKNANALLMLPGRTNERNVVKEGDIVDAMLLGFNQYT